MAGRADATVVATFTRHDEALRAVDRLGSAGIPVRCITVEQTHSGLLESFLPEDQRSARSTVTVRGKGTATLAGNVLRQCGAQEVKGKLGADIQSSATPSPRMGAVPSGSARPESTAEMADAKARIDSARSDMDQTIRAIQDRLNPEAVKARVKHSVKEATVGQVERKIGNIKEGISYNRGGVMDRIRQNPMPAALTGLGLTWLFFSKKPLSSYERRYYRPGSTYQPEYGYRGAGDGRGIAQAPGFVADKAGDLAGQVGSTIGDTAGHVGNTIGDTAGQVGATVGDTAAQLGDTVGGAADQVRSTTGQWVSQAGHQMQRVQTNLGQTMEENPLPVGLAVLGLGALVAMLVPKTSAEDRLLGETKDRLTDKAQEMTGKVSRVAQRAGSAARDEAHRQNLA